MVVLVDTVMIFQLRLVLKYEINTELRECNSVCNLV